MAHRPNLVCHLFLYGLWRKNDFNIFKWLKNNQKNNKLHKFHISVFIIRSCWDTATAMGLHVIYGCVQLQQSWIVVAETIWLQRRKYLLSSFFTKFADPWLKSECQSATGNKTLTKPKRSPGRKYKWLLADVQVQGSRSRDGWSPHEKARGINRKQCEGCRNPCAFLAELFSSSHPSPAFSKSKGKLDRDLVVLSLSWGSSATKSEDRAGQGESESFTSPDCLSFWPPMGSKEPEKDRKPTLVTNFFVRFLDEKMLMTASVWGQVGKVIKEVNAIFFCQVFIFCFKDLGLSLKLVYLLFPSSSPPLLIWEPMELNLQDLVNENAECSLEVECQIKLILQ